MEIAKCTLEKLTRVGRPPLNKDKGVIDVRKVFETRNFSSLKKFKLLSAVYRTCCVGLVLDTLNRFTFNLLISVLFLYLQELGKNRKESYLI